MEETLISNNLNNKFLNTSLMITLVILLTRLIILIYQDALAITVLATNLWKKLLLNVVTQKDAVELHGVVGVLPKETIWLILVSK